ncbi:MULTISPECIES: helix-hairpin-helix domain-containing protein, partial [unclassified Curtobacterium]
SASSSAAPSVVVHVLGAVAHAGVVTVPGGGRVTDALEAAGGASGDADLARLNLARPLVDGERLYVPRVGEVDVPQALGTDSGGGAGSGGSLAGSGASGDAESGGSAASDVVDLNTADQAALETLPGIGPGLAQRILAWRDEHGRFSAVEDLLDVSGIGDGRFAELQDRVRV